MPDTRSRPLQVGGKLKAALDLMTWGGADGLPLQWDAAARHVGFSVRSMRLAIAKPHVRRYLLEQNRAMLGAMSARNVHRAAALRDQNENRTAAVAAIRFLEAGANPGAAGPVRSPGIVLMIEKA